MIDVVCSGPKILESPLVLSLQSVIALASGYADGVLRGECAEIVRDMPPADARNHHRDLPRSERCLANFGIGC